MATRKSENRLKKRICDALNEKPKTKAIPLHGSAYSESGTPDILCISKGIPFLLEVKLPGESPTKIQDFRHIQWLDAGAHVAVVRSLGDALDVVGFEAPYYPP